MVRSAVVGAPMTDTKAHGADTSDMADTPEPLPVPSPAFDTDFAPVIRSKIQPPPLRSKTLTRQRLIDRLHEATASRVTLLVAEAGYGKTTLLADFAARSGQRTLWYRLDPTDADSITWTNYLIAACREVDPSFGEATLRLLSHLRAGNPPRSAFVDSLIGELIAWTAAPTTLILDDFHHVDRSSEVCDVVARLIDNCPAWLHFVIATRRRPPLELARLDASGAVSQLRGDELRFSESETSRLFAESFGMPLERETVRALDRRTRGWIASLWLFFSSARNRSPQDTFGLAESLLSGGSTPIYDFLAEEVLAQIPDHLELVLMRISILEAITPALVAALFREGNAAPPSGEAERWLDEAERLGLLAHSSSHSEAFALHPLLREFLALRLKDKAGPEETADLHRRVARALIGAAPLDACRHLLAAGEEQGAMDLLESTILQTLGSGLWGQASDLLDRLQHGQAGPGVAAITARKLMDEGDLAGAERMLEAVQSESSSAPVRAAVRQTRLALGWRTDNGALILESVDDLLSDTETPPALRDIAQIFRDANPDSPSPKTLRILASRLAKMDRTQTAVGLDFFSAVSLHNACVAYLAAADFAASLDAGQLALAAFSRLQFLPAEALSTHSVLAVALMESGRMDEARLHVTASMADGREFADVPASIAVAFLSAGFREEALTLVSRAQALERQGRSDVAGIEITEMADAYSRLGTNASSAIEVLSEPRPRVSLDLGHALERQMMLAHAYLAAGDHRAAAAVARSALDEARGRGADRAQTRLALIAALAEGDAQAVSLAIRDTTRKGHLALAEMADVLSERLELATECTNEIAEAIGRHPLRWLPELRRVLGRGAPGGHRAAYFMDQFGEAQDVGVLRAYARTYRRRGAPQSLGIALAKRASPKLRIHDLGRVMVEIGTRSVAVSGMRRKPAALLVYLITRPGFTAHREQVIDELWPDADPAAALNSLNQSLYFLRREIDPWYEDGVSPEYVGFEGDLLWLEAELVSADSVDFLGAVAAAKRVAGAASIEGAARAYTGHFAPEFEYEEWALAHRSKLKSTFLEVVMRSISALLLAGDLEEARNVAIAALEIDDTAGDVERALIWLHWRLGAQSAARAQYEHLARADEFDGVDPIPFRTLVEGKAPIGR